VELENPPANTALCGALAPATARPSRSVLCCAAGGRLNSEEVVCWLCTAGHFYLASLINPLLPADTGCLACFAVCLLTTICPLQCV
jgi:hypothetical protein